MQTKLLLLVTVALLLSFPKTVFAQVPDLGASASFALFTAAGAFNGDAATSIVGDIGTNVGAYTPPGFLVGNVHLADPVSAQAAADVALAYGYLAGLTCGSVLAATLGNAQTLSPNIYCIGSAAVLNANLILDGGGTPGAIFIF
ncbi:MAG: ice-binding family protein, partial [Saprospiraceae bacterium]